MNHLQDNQWKNDELKEERADKCSWAENKTKIIYLDQKVKNVINTLCQKVKVEWQIFLVGEEREEEVIAVDYYIPKQKVTSSSVENEENITKEFISENRIVVGVHSHSDMGVFFSSVDNETNYSDVRFHIVVNNKGEYKAIQQISLPCGMKTCVETKVATMGKEDIEIVGIEKITEESWISKCGPQQKQYDFGTIESTVKHKKHAFQEDGALDEYERFYTR